MRPSHLWQRPSLLLLFTVATLSAFSSAPSQTIVGQVLDAKTRSPLAHFNIRLVPDTEMLPLRVLARTTADSNGIFYLEAPTPGTYRLLFDRINVRVRSAPLVVNDSGVQRQYLIDPAAERSYFEFEVDKQVSTLPNHAHPKYPESLREANVEGQVLAQFDVDADGKPLMWTFQVVKSTHPDFAESVRIALPLFQFLPAELHGRKVKQLVQMPFVFSLNR